MCRPVLTILILYFGPMWRTIELFLTRRRATRQRVGPHHAKKKHHKQRTKEHALKHCLSGGNNQNIKILAGPTAHPPVWHMSTRAIEEHIILKGHRNRRERNWGYGHQMWRNKWQAMGTQETTVRPQEPSRATISE